MLRFSFFILFLISSSFLNAQAFKIDPIRSDSTLHKTPHKIIDQILVISNKITKERIIHRELLFQLGDTLSSNNFLETLEQSKKNLLNTSLFNFVKIDWALIDNNHVVLVITVTERWYTFPLPIFEIDDINFNTWWKDRDYSRINYGFHLIRNNFRGRKEKLTMTAQFGFSERFRLRYNIPYLTKNQKSGLNFNFSYNRKDEISYTSINNERVQFKSTDSDAIKNLSSGVTYNYRNAIFNTHSLGINHDFNKILDSVRLLNPEYLGNNKTITNFISLYYQFTHDNRDSKNYPLKGNYFSVSFKKSGLGIFDDKVDVTNFNVLYKNYWKINDRTFIANSIRAEYSPKKNQPYILQNGLGYSSSYAIRAYENNIIDGQNIGLAKVQLRYQLVTPREVELQFLQYEKISKFHYAFYIGIFSDFAYVDDNLGFQQNTLANDFLYSSGIGLDFISYYDVVLRTEFSVNKFGESGIFLHFVAPI
jgi:outer membrane protein assembly factor BamA